MARATPSSVRPVHAESFWYPLAYCELSDEVRIFQIDRTLETAFNQGDLDPCQPYFFAGLSGGFFTSYPVLVLLVDLRWFRPYIRALHPDPFFFEARGETGSKGGNPEEDQFRWEGEML